MLKSISNSEQGQISLVERCVRDAEAGGSNPLTPTKISVDEPTDSPWLLGFLFFRLNQSLFKGGKTLTPLTFH